MPYCHLMKILKNLRKAVKVIGLLDALIDEFERELASKQVAKDRVSEICKEASDLIGKKNAS